MARAGTGCQKWCHKVLHVRTQWRCSGGIGISTAVAKCPLRPELQPETSGFGPAQRDSTASVVAVVLGEQVNTPELSRGVQICQRL